METVSVLVALCGGNTSLAGGFPTQRPVMRSSDVYFSLGLAWTRCFNRSICAPRPKVMAVLLKHKTNMLNLLDFHYGDVIMSAMASQITSFTIVCSTVYSGADQRKHQSSASLAFSRGIHRWAVNSPHIWPVTRKMFPFDDVIMLWHLASA